MSGISQVRVFLTLLLSVRASDVPSAAAVPSKSAVLYGSHTNRHADSDERMAAYADQRAHQNADTYTALLLSRGYYAAEIFVERLSGPDHPDCRDVKNPTQPPQRPGDFRRDALVTIWREANSRILVPGSQGTINPVTKAQKRGRGRERRGRSQGVGDVL